MRTIYAAFKDDKLVMLSYTQESMWFYNLPLPVQLYTVRCSETVAADAVATLMSGHADKALKHLKTVAHSFEFLGDQA